jgi:hypothetical protein
LSEVRQYATTSLRLDFNIITTFGAIEMN